MGVVVGVVSFNFVHQAQEAEEADDIFFRNNYAQKALNLNISAVALYVILVLSIAIVVVSHFVVLVHVDHS